MPDATAATAAPAPACSPAVEALVRRGLPLVQYAVSDMAGRPPRHVHRDDLVSAGMLGLAQAAKSWDESRGVTFERYARSRIQGALLDELRSRDWATRSVRANARRLQAATDELTARTGRAPETAELSAALGLAPQEVQKLTDDVHRATVLHYDALIGEADDGPVGPVATSDALEPLLQREMVAYLRDAVVTLPERLRTVVVQYFFEERQMQDIADELGVTESRVSQMRAEAIVLLRAALQAVEPDVAPQPEPAGRAAKRTAAYLAEVAAASDFAARLSTSTPGVVERVSAMTA